jgi:UDP-N-acetylmuramoyl-L-alanyl-D-glutamate--2,6-diaminopimelate ligase
MRLDRLIAADLAGDDADLQVTGLAYDSRKAGPGTLFCCVQGYRQDGHEFAAQAVAAGAVALLVQRPLGLGVPEIVVPSVRAAMGPVAARFYEDPTAELKAIGITGTNGKTTTAYLVRSLLQAAGERTGLLGTVTSVIGAAQRPVGRTTPEAIDLQAAFREMLDAGDEACAMEVSSHALALGRTDGISFAAAVFTNISRDHLDFHPTMEDYYRAKRRLFLPEADPPPGISVVNAGDPYGRRLAGEIGEDAVTFAVQSEAGHRADEDDAHRRVAEREADYRATGLECDAGGCAFTLHTPAGERAIELPMPGRFNVENALGALAAVHALGHDLDTLVTALRRGERVPGRFEPVGGARGFAVVVDYAHTPDSLQNVLRAAREIARGRVICVFGAGGDRDRGKRPLMGGIAARLADVAVVTSDNPRSESPEAIVEEILAGIPARARASVLAGARTGADADAGVRAVEGEVHVEVDRRKAIEWAIGMAGADDLVVIAGKGHEQGQELADGVKLPFDDRLVAEEALRARGTRIAGVGTGR